MILKKLAAVAASLTALAGVANAQPGSFIDLGNIGAAGNFVFTTDGSVQTDDSSLPGVTVDTELAIWDAAGLLLDSDDDGSTGLFSLIDIDLADGEYFLGISEFNSIFADGFLNDGTGFEAGEFGDLVLNLDGLFLASGIAGFDPSGDATLETLFFRVVVGDADVVPLPAAFPLFLAGLAGLGVARRKKSA